MNPINDSVLVQNEIKGVNLLYKLNIYYRKNRSAAHVQERV